MKLYFVSYDLRKPGQQYSRLWARLEAAGAQRALESLWVLRSPYNSVAIREDLSRFIDSNDRIFVAEMVASNWATYGSMIDVNAA